MEQDALMVHYHKLDALLDEETHSIAHSFQGELLDEYRKALMKERKLLQEVIRNLSVL